MAESQWTDELKQEVIEAYQEANPTPDNTMDIVKQLAEDYEKTVNGVRMILTKADVYVKKVAIKPSAKKEGSKRVSRQDAIDQLTAVLEAANLEVDEDIINRLTGKAALYFTNILKGNGEG